MSTWKKAIDLQLKRFLKERKEALSKALIAFVIGTLTFFITMRTSLWDWSELLILKTFNEYRGPKSPPKDIVIASLDDNSYTRLNASPRWPFPRKYSAEVIERIANVDPRVMILDLAINHEEQDPAANERLEKALRSARVALYSGIKIKRFETDGVGEHDKNTYSTPSDPRFNDAAKMLLPMWTDTVLSVAIPITTTPNPDAPPFDRVPISKALIELGGYKFEVPVGKDRINYYGPAGTISRIPFHEILTSTQDKLVSTFKDKIVLVGLQSVESGREKGKDELDVPLTPSAMFGVEIHATIAANLIESSWLRTPSEIERERIAIALVAVIGLVGLCVPFEIASILLPLLFLGSVALSYSRFAFHNQWLPFLLPIGVMCVLTFAANLALNYSKKKREGKHTENIMDFDHDY